MIEAVRDWFLSCPLLQPNTLFSVDKLGADPVEYDIAPLSCNPIVKKFCDGGSIRQFQFAFASREEYDARQNMKNTAFYEQLTTWLEQQSDKGNLPKLENGRKAQYIEILSSGYVYDTGDSTAIYQMELSLIYSQKAGY